MRPRLDRLESLRAFACIGAVTFHCYISLLGPWSVSVFIMLSGFLHTYNGINRAEFFPMSIADCAGYAFKKIRKLYPLYFISLVILILRIVLLAPENPPREQIIIFAKQFVYCALLIQSWLPDTDWAFALNAVGWYLSTSLFLYFAFPFILRMVKLCKSTRSAICAIILIYLSMLLVGGLVSMAYKRITGSDVLGSGSFQHWFCYVFPPFRLGDFSIGCLLGFIFTKADNEKLKYAGATAFELAAIALFILSQALFVRTKFPTFISYNMLFVPSTIFLIYSFAMGRGHISRILDNRVTRFIADYSVEIFLIHFAVVKYASPFTTLFLTQVFPLSFRLQQVIFLCFAFILTIVASIIYRRFSRRFPFFAVK